MTAPTCFSLTTTDHVAHLVLSRPAELNTMHPTFWRELDDLLTRIHHEGTARALVISSTGKHFSAGMALETFAGGIQMDDQSPEGRAAIFDVLTDIQATFTKIENLRIPVICAIQGGCIGGAVDMVTAACIRYASADAFFCIQEINIGMVADVGTLQRLPRLIPSGMVRELAYTGRRLPATRAKEIGLVNEVYADVDALRSGVMQVAREIAEHSPLAVHGTKEVLNYARDHSVQDSLLYMAAWQSGMFQPADMKECLAAKQEKRAPVFEDLAPMRKFDD